jgi:hypothetical protein
MIGRPGRRLTERTTPGQLFDPKPRPTPSTPGRPDHHPRATDHILDMSIEPTLEDQELLEETLRRLGSGMPRREVFSVMLSTAGFLAAVAGIWLIQDPDSFSVLPGLLCVRRSSASSTPRGLLNPGKKLARAVNQRPKRRAPMVRHSTPPPLPKAARVYVEVVDLELAVVAAGQQRELNRLPSGHIVRRMDVDVA